MKETTKKAKKKAWESTTGLMVQGTMETGLITKSVGSGCIVGPIPENSRGTG